MSTYHFNWNEDLQIMNNRQKHILIVISSFRWGGINRSLQSWLKLIDPAEYDVDLFVMVHSGNYDGVFTHCRLLPSDKRLEALIDQSPLRHGVAKMRSLSLKAINKISKGRLQHHVYKKVGSNLTGRKRYDAIIAWGEGVPTIFTSHIVHPNKIAWIHCDYTNYTNGPTERNIYGKFKSIVCVSKYTRETFLSYYPEMEPKVHAIYNILDVEEIRQKAMEPMDIEYDRTKFNIVSVGRVSHVKRFSAIPAIAKKLVDAGCDFQWYIVGPYSIDDEYNKIVNDIKELGLENKVILVGGKINPYPYIANANLLVSTSISEAAPYVVLEAFILGKPVVTADFGSASEFVVDGDNGFVFKFDEFPTKICDLLKSHEQITALTNNLAHYKYNNLSVANAISTLI